MTYTAQDRRQSFLGRMEIEQACFRKAGELDLTLAREYAAFMATPRPPYGICSLRYVYVPDSTFRRWKALAIAAVRLRHWPAPIGSFRTHDVHDGHGLAIYGSIVVQEGWHRG